MEFETSADAFKAVLPGLLEDVRKSSASIGAPSNVMEHIIQTLDLSNRNSGHNEGLTIPECGLVLLERPLNSQEFLDMATLGWLVEFLLASYSITGGLMDGEGLQPSNEMLSLNDALTLKSAVFVLLKKHFRGHPAYLNFLETFHEISFLIEMGEEAGRIASKEQKPREWSSDQYGFIVRHRSACDSYYLSVCLALHYLGLDTPKNIQQTRDVLLTGGNHRLLGSGVQGVSSPHAETGTSTSHLCDDSQHEALQDSYGKDNPKLAAILEYIRLCGLKEAPLHP